MKEGTMKRLLKMLWSKYKIHLIVVFLCIVGNALFNVQGTMFMQTLIDDYIVPLLKSSSPDFSGLFHALIRVGALYACGVVCAFTFNRIMVYVTQGFLRDLRIGMFEHMESLPIRYFDRTPHGDTMSVYKTIDFTIYSTTYFKLYDYCDNICINDHFKYSFNCVKCMYAYDHACCIKKTWIVIR